MRWTSALLLMVSQLGMSAGAFAEEPRVGRPYLVTEVDGGEEARSSDARGFTSWGDRVYFTTGEGGSAANLWWYLPSTGVATKCAGFEGWDGIEILGETEQGLVVTGVRLGVGKVLARVLADGGFVELTMIGGLYESQSVAWVESGGGRVMYAVFEEFSREGALWVTDGTEGGTGPVVGFERERFNSITAVGGQFLISTLGGLWINDGTTLGSRRIDSAAELVGFVIGAEVVAPGRAIIGTYLGLGELNLETGVLTTLATVGVSGGPVVLGDQVVFWSDGRGLVSWLREAGGEIRTLVASGENSVQVRRAGDRAVASWGSQQEGETDGIWSTDGTPGGTLRLVEAGPYAWNATSQTDGDVVWVAIESVSGTAAQYRTDGTAQGTIRTNTLSQVWNSRAIQGSLYGIADGAGLIGAEPWRLDERGRGAMIGDLAPSRLRGLNLGSPRFVSGDRLWITSLSPSWTERKLQATKGQPGDLTEAVDSGDMSIALFGDGLGGALGMRVERDEGIVAQTLVKWNAPEAEPTVLGVFPNAGDYTEWPSTARGEGVWAVSDGTSLLVTDGTAAGTRVALDNYADGYASSWFPDIAWTGSWFAFIREGGSGGREYWRVTGEEARFTDAWAGEIQVNLRAFGGRVWRTLELDEGTRVVWESSDGEGPFTAVREGLPRYWSYVGAARGKWIIQEFVYPNNGRKLWVIDEGDVSLASMRLLTELPRYCNNLTLLNGRAFATVGRGLTYAIVVDLLTGAFESLPVAPVSGWVYPTEFGDVAVLYSRGVDGYTLWVTDGTAAGTRVVPGGPWHEPAALGIVRGRLFVHVYTPGLGRQIVAANLCAGDFTGNGVLDGEDLVEFVEAFDRGERGDEIRADVNGDGFLDWFDYAEFVELYEAGCEV